MYKWTADLSVGNNLIDQEHKHLFELLEKFYLSMMGKSSKIDLLDLVKGLCDYAQVHFADEEAFMTQVNYPELENHAALHKDFMEKANDFYEKLQSGKLLLTIEVTNFIKDWLVSHIKGEDMKIVQYAKTITSSQALQ
ncbi:MAG: bacteriohemerythrin [Breznakibacter sp.]